MKGRFSGTDCNISLWPVVHDGMNVSFILDRDEQASDERKEIIKLTLQLSWLESDCKMGIENITYKQLPTRKLLIFSSVSKVMDAPQLQKTLCIYRYYMTYVGGRKQKSQLFFNL